MNRELVHHIWVRDTGDMSYLQELEIIGRYRKYLCKHMSRMFHDIPEVRSFNYMILKKTRKLPSFTVFNHWNNTRSLMWWRHNMVNFDENYRRCLLV
jgi:hypothetical protein